MNTVVNGVKPTNQSVDPDFDNYHRHNRQWYPEATKSSRKGESTGPGLIGLTHNPIYPDRSG